MASTTIANPKPTAERMVSIDAYRGFVMLLMIGEVLSFYDVSQALPQSSFWRFLAFHQSHVEWIGCSLHDMIQPSFSFLVGVALPFSLASRQAKGQSRQQMTWHAVGRSIALILLGVFLRSIGRSQTYWTFEDTLSQIGMGYVFLFLLGWRSVRTQWLAFAGILVGYWLAFALYPVPAAFDYAAVGVPPDWGHLLHSFLAHWNKNSNLAWAFDRWFLNLFPREHPFVFNEGGYCTLSFVPTLATMILGLIAGNVLRSERVPGKKLQWLIVAGAIGLLSGEAVEWLHICPVVKRIWTPAWVLFSGGWCCWFTAASYFLVDLKRWRAWSFPLVVVGTNSIAAYCIDHLFEDFIKAAWLTHLGPKPFQIFGLPYQPLVLGVAALTTMWGMLYWMQKRKIFLRI